MHVCLKLRILNCTIIIYALFSCCVLFADQTTFTEKHVESLEKWIDELSENLPTLSNFILPVSCFVSIKTL